MQWFNLTQIPLSAGAPKAGIFMLCLLTKKDFAGKEIMHMGYPVIFPVTKDFSNQTGDITSKTCHHLQPWGTASGSDPAMQCTPPMHTGSCGKGVLKSLFPFP